MADRRSDDEPDIEDEPGVEEAPSGLSSFAEGIRHGPGFPGAEATPGIDDEEDPDAGTVTPRDSRLDDITQQIKESGERTSRILEERERALGPRREAVVKAAEGSHVDMPELDRIEKQPNIHRELTKTAEDWMGIATMIAMIGAGRSRTAGTTGLQAMAGIFNGIRQGNEDRVQQEWKQFKAANDAIIANNRELVQEYSLRLKDKKMDLDQKIAEMQIVASTYQDQVMAEALRRRDLVDIGKLIAKQAEVANKAEQSLLKAKELKSRIELNQERVKKMKEAKETQESGGLEEEDRKFFAKQENAGDHSWRLGFTGRSIENARARASVMKEAAKMAREEGRTGESQAHRTAKFEGEKAASRQIQIRLENITAFAKIADKQFKNAIDASEKYKRYGWRAGNMAWQAWFHHTGSPELREFGAAIQAAITAWARAINSGGQRTVHDTEKGEQMASTLFNHEDVVAVMNQFRKEIGLEEEALQEDLDTFEQRHTSPAERNRVKPAPKTDDEGWTTLPSGKRIRQLD